MKKLLVGLILMIEAVSACHRGGNKSGDVKQDTAVQVTPHTIQEIQDISEVITRFVRGYSSRDNGKVNSLIHPDLGLTIIHRPGVADQFVRVDSLDFSNPYPNYYPYPDFANDYALIFGTLPEFSCETEKWSVQGFVCDTVSHPTQLTNIALFENEFEEGSYSKEKLDDIKKNEEESFRVIVTAKDPLIFHVQLYQGRWYITVLDRAYGGCDA